MSKGMKLSAPSKGFTIIELMIAVVIVGVLAAIAIPGYKSHVDKAHRSDAKAVLLQNVQAMERFYTTNNTYVGAALSSTVSPVGSSGASTKYNISFSAGPTATTYTIQAEPVGTMAGDGCGIYTVNQAGVQTDGGGGSVECNW